MTRRLPRRACFLQLLALCCAVAACGGDRDAATADTIGVVPATTLPNDAVHNLPPSTTSSSIQLDTTPPPPANAPSAPSAPAADTIRGIIRRIGAEPLARLALQPANGSGPTFALSGPLLQELNAASGLEVMLEGRFTTERAPEVAPGGAAVYDVRAYHVRAADGVEAHDGTLVIQGDVAYLDTPGAPRVRLESLPAALKSSSGARVFLVGPLTAAPQAFGVLRKR